MTVHSPILIHPPLDTDADTEDGKILLGKPPINPKLPSNSRPAKWSGLKRRTEETGRGAREPNGKSKRGCCRRNPPPRLNRPPPAPPPSRFISTSEIEHCINSREGVPVIRGSRRAKTCEITLFDLGSIFWTFDFEE
ncbi:uncharacterized protein [Coffea arabica]|uniref:Uncharacterized protein n=1 Tax=Coffea arabica TaxID=13443 RepID=A0ABM4UAX0_COFAR